MTAFKRIFNKNCAQTYVILFHDNSYVIFHDKRYFLKLLYQSEKLSLLQRISNRIWNKGACFFYVLGTSATSDPADGDGPSTVGPLGPVGTLMPLSGRSGIAGIRRGPGRPRLRPTGPGHQGYRTSGHHHGKKIQRPLPVPIRSHQTIAGAGQHQQKASSSSSQKRPSSITGTSSSSSSVTIAATNSTPLLSSSSSSSSSSMSLTESRPFGFYTQHQPRAGSS